MSKLNPDFGGYVTAYNVKCTDGRTIMPGAFEHMNGSKVPLVWQHGHNEVSNVLGHGLLEDREKGMYLYGFFNDSEDGQKAKLAVQHRDITALSIYANALIEKAKRVAHGVIQEASLVLSGANPGAKIDYVALQHDDGFVMESEDEAVIHSGFEIELPAEELDESEEDEILEGMDVIVHADKTVGDVFETLSEEQKTAVYAIVGYLMEGGEMKQSAITEEENLDEGDSNTMKKNVFAGDANEEENALAHVNFAEIQQTARELGSLRAAVIKHAGTYGVGSDRANLELLFPDARNVTKEPTWIARRMEWVSGVLNGTKHTPFSRIKSMHADITADEARARGYITGNQKVEEVFPVLRRVTTPITIYKKQKLDRDDIIDITDFNIVSWLKGEMRVMLDEEIARAVLVGDGRDPVADLNDWINTDNVRPIYGDSTVYVYNLQVASTRTDDEMIDDLITARIQYRGSGQPSLYVAPSLLVAWLLLKDADGRRLYRGKAELAADLNVKEIIEVPVMDGVQNDITTPTHNLRAIMVNLSDYVIGADRGGEVNFFDDFDIDYNQYKYLIETRISGAMVQPKGAITLEQAIV